MGLYAVLHIATNIVSKAGNLGLKKVMVRLVSSYHVVNDIKNMRKVYWTSLGLGLISITFFSLITVFIFSYFHLFDISNPQLDPWLLLLTLLIVSIRFHAGGGLEGLKRFEILSVYVAGAFTISRIISIILAPWMGITGVLYGWLLGEGLGFILVLWEVAKSFKRPTFGYSLLTLQRQGLPLFVADFANVSLEWGDRVVVALYSLSWIGLFHVAASGATFISTASVAVYMGALPHLSEAFQSGGTEELVRKVKELGRYVILFSAPIGIGGAMLGYPLIQIFAGPNFLEVVPIFMVMSFGIWLSALNTLFQSGMIAAGLNKEVMYSTIAGTVVDIFVFIGLVGRFGLLSAGFARALLYIVSFVFSTYFLYTRSGLVVDWAATWKAYLSSFLMGIAIYGLWLYLEDVLYLPLYVGFGAVIYILMLRLLRVAEIDELAMLQQSLPEKFRWGVKVICMVAGVRYELVEKRAAEMI
jgi:O-antigen/teichoic acid export membrane protein